MTRKMVCMVQGIISLACMAGMILTVETDFLLFFVFVFGGFLSLVEFFGSVVALKWPERRGK